MNDDFLAWLDEQADPEPQSEGWMCDSIDKAEGAARRLRAATDKVADIDKVADRIIADATAWRDEASARYWAIVNAEKANLETFLKVQIAEGGAKSAPLPWGVTIKARQTGGTLRFGDGFVERAPEAILRPGKPSIDAAKAKEYYTVTDAGVVVDPNGEVVEDVIVTPKADKFEVVA